MPFGLNNISATYQSMTNIIFQEIGEMLEVDMDDMIVKFNQELLHAQHLQWVLNRVQKYNMRLNLEKSIFRVRVSEFLYIYLTE